MKKIFFFLSLVSLLTSCEVEDYNQGVAPKDGVHTTKQPVADYLVGDWTAAGANISITKERVLIAVVGMHKDLDLTEHRTAVIMVEDCFLEIYMPDGTVYTIWDWVWFDDTITIVVDGKTIRLHREGREETPIVTPGPVG